MFIGDKIRAIREAQGMSQERLAALAETSRWTITRIESRQVMPRPATLARICEALGVGPDFFLLWTQVRPARANRRRRIEVHA